MEQVAGGKIDFNYDAEDSVFRRTWNAIAGAVPTGDIFYSKHGSSMSPTIFEVVSLAVAFNLDTAEAMPPVDLKDRLVSIVESAKSGGLTGAGSNSQKKTRGRVEMAKTAFEPR